MLTRLDSSPMFTRLNSKPENPTGVVLRSRGIERKIHFEPTAEDLEWVATHEPTQTYVETHYDYPDFRCAINQNSWIKRVEQPSGGRWTMKVVSVPTTGHLQYEVLSTKASPATDALWEKMGYAPYVTFDVKRYHRDLHYIDVAIPRGWGCLNVKSVGCGLLLTAEGAIPDGYSAIKLATSKLLWYIRVVHMAVYALLPDRWPDTTHYPSGIRSYLEFTGEDRHVATLAEGRVEARQ